MADYAKNNVIYEEFYHWKHTTGLVDGDWTKVVKKNNVVQGSTTVTVTEDSGGKYIASYNPTTDGYWELDIHETAETRVHYMQKHIVGLVSTLITNETLNENITNVQADVVNAIDSQELDQVRQIAEGIYDIVDEQRRITQGVRK